MKKIIALVVVLVLCLSVFAACGDQAETETSTPAEETASEVVSPSEEVVVDEAAFTWNGNKEVWAIVPTTNAEGLMMICDAMGEACVADGWTYSVQDAAGDPAAQVNFVETATASNKVGALMVAAMDVVSLENAVVEAQEAGIIVVYLGAEPSTYTIASEVYTAYEITGYYAVLAVEAWAAANTDAAVADDSGKVPVAIDTFTDILDGQYRSNAFRDRTNESDTLYVYHEGTTYGDNAETLGYDWAETQMLANPLLRIFLCYEPDCAYGVNTYLAEYAEENDLDLADFCVICCYEDTETPALLEQATADASSTAFKGYVTYGDAGGPPVVGAKLAEEILGVANGTWEYGVYYYDSINAYTSFGYTATWKMGDENPAAKYKY